MKIYLKSLVWIIMFGLAGCQPGNSTKQSSDRLISAKWIFSGLKNKDTRVFESIPAELHGMNIVFNNSHGFQANSSCNTAYGYYLIAGLNSIKIDSIVMTKMFCMDSIRILWEDKYISGLKSTSSFEITGDSLSLRTGSDIEMIFKADLPKN